MLLAARPATPLGVPEAAGSRAEKKPRLVCWWGDARRAGRRVLRLLPIIGVLSSVPWSGLAQETQELAKQAQNPIANLISVPLQHNFNFGVGPEEDLQYVLNIQPVIPVNLTKGWTLVARSIIPVIYQPLLAPGIGRTWGLGDIQTQLFFCPPPTKGIIWGGGPVLVYPSATDDVLGTGKFLIGPTAVALTIQGPWLVGLLVNNVFSVAGNSDRGDVNQMLIQPIVNYNMKGGWYLAASPVITADWKKDSDRWTVPLGGGVGRVFHVGKQALNAYLQAFSNVVRPDNAAKWSLRFQVQFLFPKH